MTSVISFLSDAWLAVAVHLWQTTLVLIPILLLARWARRAPAGVLHALWSIALIKLLLPAAAVSAGARWIVSRLPDSVAGVGSMASPVTLETFRVLLDPTRAVSAGDLGRWSLLTPGLLLLTALWGAGMVIVMMRLGRDLATMRGAATGATIGGTEWERTELAAALDETDIPRPRVMLTDEPTVPHVAGLLRPHIVVPRVLVRELSTGELRAVLLHEESHRRRFEPLRGVFQRICAAMFFFYPLLWVVMRRLQQAAELICDAAVLRSGVSARTYGRALARTVSLGLVPAALPSGIGGGAGPHLRHRLERISQTGRFHLMRRHGFVLAAAVALVISGLLLPAPSTQASDEGAEEARALEFVEFDTPPEAVKAVPAEYPEIARKAGAGGRVWIRVTIDEEGLVTGAIGEKVDAEVEEHPELGEAALVAGRQWMFKPARANDKPVKCQIIIPFKFSLDDDAKANEKKRERKKEKDS